MKDLVVTCFTGVNMKACGMVSCCNSLKFANVLTCELWLQFIIINIIKYFNFLDILEKKVLTCSWLGFANKNC